MLAFKIKVYDKLDLKRIVQYWFDSRAFISTKLNDRKSSSYNKIDNIKKTKEKDDKKTEKYETNVKYDYKKPDNDLLKIIPFCNNILSIQINSSTFKRQIFNWLKLIIVLKKL